MAVEIVPDDVTDGFQTEAPASEIELAISLVAAADPCLDKHDVPEATQVALKVYAVRHILTMQAGSGQGTVSSQTAPSGASQSFASYRGSKGSRFRELLEQLDLYGCVRSVLDADSRIYLQTVGGANRRAR